MAEGEELGELVGLLEDWKPEVRRGAAELVAGLTAEGSGLALLRGVRAEHFAHRGEDLARARAACPCMRNHEKR